MRLTKDKILDREGDGSGGGGGVEEEKEERKGGSPRQGLDSRGWR